MLHHASSERIPLRRSAGLSGGDLESCLTGSDSQTARQEKDPALSLAFTNESPGAIRSSGLAGSDAPFLIRKPDFSLVFRVFGTNGSIMA